VIIRNFEYLLALHREQHFSRAAATCSVSQPTLSAGIKQLEEDMGVQIVTRGRRYEGLTPEGLRVLAWAQQMLEDCQRLKQELNSFRERALGGPFNVGVLPATTALASVMSVPFAEKVPDVKLSVETLATDVLWKRLRAGQLDVALAYIADTPEDGITHHLLYREHMYVLSPNQALGSTRVTLQHVASTPLCLLRSSLPPDLEARLVATTNVLMTDSMSILEATLATGRYATVIPQSLASQLSPRLAIQAYPLRDQSSQANVGFVTRRSEQISPLVHIWFELAHTPEMVKSIRTMLSSHKAFMKKPTD
jgi:DNA-binding transcriptional LysR family regulator